jgi:hypothetical protein
VIKIQLFAFAKFPVEIDGEPWFQEPCTVSIAHHGQVIILKLPVQLAGFVAVEVLKKLFLNFLSHSHLCSHTNISLFLQFILGYFFPTHSTKYQVRH